MDRILILEDDPLLRNSISRLLSAEQGFDTYDTATLSEALAAIEQEQPDIIVADLSLPDGSGADLLRAMSERNKSIPIVFITAYLERHLKEHPELEGQDMLAKPFSNSDLVDRVRVKLADTRLSMPPNSAFTVSDYLQLAGMARRSVILTVQGTDVEGQIVVQGGIPVWSQDREGMGKGAFQRLSMMSRADVTCSPFTTWTAKPNLEGSLEQLLLDAARLVDEARRGNTGEPSAARAAGPRSVPRPTPPPRREKQDAPAADSVAKLVQKVPPPNASLTPAAGVAARPDVPKPRPVPPPPPSSRDASTQSVQPSPSEKGSNMSPSSKSSQAILAAVPGVAAVARADEEGSVVEFAGEFDAETACAVATLAVRPLSDIVNELGLGDLQSWCVSRGDNTWYVIHEPKQLLVAQGALNKNPVSVLKKIELGARG